MRALATIGVLAVASPVAAEVLEMRQFDSTNVHMANQAGATHSSEDISITVNLGGNGRVTVLSKGTRKEHVLDVINGTNYNTDETTTWVTGWKGGWKIVKGALVMELGTVKDTCTAEKTEQGTKSAMTCKAARDGMVMRCSATSVKIEVGAKKTKKVAAWKCASEDERDIGESPTTWWLGKGRCIEVRAGRMMPLSFGPCR
ncbi:MAG: hypothetical protein ACKV2T_06490 [Kofleriaceae bacterium]